MTKQAKFRRAVVHAGLDKAGSTSIQRAFALNRERLAELGICYPMGEWHAQLGSCMATEPSSFVFNAMRGRIDLEQIAEEDGQYLEGLKASIEASVAADQLVVSYEGFVDLSVEGLTNLRSFLEGFADSVEVIAYCRAPLAYARSAAGQRVRSGLLPWSPPPYFPFRDILPKLFGAFGRDKVNVRAFDRSRLRRGDVVRDVAGFLGLHDEQFDRLEAIDSVQSNRSLSNEALLIGERIIARTQGCFSSAGEFEALFLDLLDEIDGTAIVMPTVEKDAVLQVAQAHVDYLRDEVGIQLPDEPDVPVSPATGGLPDVTVATLATTFIRCRAPHLDTSRELRSPDLVVQRLEINGPSIVLRGDILSFEVELDVLVPMSVLEGGVHVHDLRGQWMFGTNTTLQGASLQASQCGRYLLTHHLLADLPAGRYHAGVAFCDRSGSVPRNLVWMNTPLTFEVKLPEGPGASEVVGVVRPPVAHSWLCRTTADDGCIVRAPVGGCRFVDPPPRLQAGAVVELVLEYRNDGDADWTGDFVRPLSIVVEWVDAHGLRSPAARTIISQAAEQPVGVETASRLAAKTQAPSLPGRYGLAVTIEQPGVGRFHEVHPQFEADQVEVTVHA